ncbi:MAG UNVERIFIED_CONTAM: hypothetical protein LVR18_20355 [Planctomycetaceae bacterium]|jgi:ParB family chromosome partitioning protein
MTIDANSRCSTPCQTGARTTPDAIKSALTEKMVESGDKLARFVGKDSYIAAGGSTRTDLFGEEVYFENPALLQKLAQGKLDAARKELEARGLGLGRGEC